MKIRLHSSPSLSLWDWIRVFKWLLLLRSLQSLPLDLQTSSLTATPCPASSISTPEPPISSFSWSGPAFLVDPDADLFPFEAFSAIRSSRRPKVICHLFVSSRIYCFCAGSCSDLLSIIVIWWEIRVLYLKISLSFAGYWDLCFFERVWVCFEAALVFREELFCNES